MGRSKRGTIIAEVSTRQLRSRARASNVHNPETSPAPLTDKPKSSRRGRAKATSLAIDNEQPAEVANPQQNTHTEVLEVVSTGVREPTPPTEEDVLLGYCEHAADKGQPVDAEVKEASSSKNQSSFSDCDNPKTDFSHPVSPSAPPVQQSNSEVPQLSVEESTVPLKEEGEEAAADLNDQTEEQEEKEETEQMEVDEMKTDPQCTTEADTGTEEVVDVQILREESPSFSPPPTPPAEGLPESSAGNKSTAVLIPGNNVSPLTSNDMKSLNVETKFKLELKETDLDNDAYKADANSFQTEEQVCNIETAASAADETLDYVDELKPAGQNRQPEATKFECLQDVFSLTPEEQPGSNDVARLSPARNPPSTVIHLRGLVRPYLINHLKALLSMDGPIVDSLFWIDRIKSHCFATYEDIQTAEKTRDRLHGLCWPSGSPKLLQADFSTADERDSFANADKAAPENSRPKLGDLAERTGSSRFEFVERKFPVVAAPEKPLKKPAIREWDIPKLEKQKELLEKTTTTSDNKTEGKKETKSGDPNKQESGKLLDDLFRKTKAKPSIYWLPLTEEQARRKRQEEEMRRRAVEKRIEESRMLRMSKRSPPPAQSSRRWYEDRRRRRSRSGRSISRHQRRYRSRSTHAVR